MGRDSNQKIKLSSGFLLFSGKKLLLLERAKDAGNGGTWGIPGGQRTGDEASYAGALREAEEEMGEMPAHAIIGHVKVERPGRLYELFAVRGRKRIKKDWQPDLNEEHDSYKWVNLDWCIAHQDSLHPVLEMLVDDPEQLAWLETMFTTPQPDKFDGARRATDFDVTANRPWA